MDKTEKPISVSQPPKHIKIYPEGATYYPEWKIPLSDFVQITRHFKADDKNNQTIAESVAELRIK